MTVNLRGRDFLKLLDYTPEEITYLIDLANAVASANSNLSAIKRKEEKGNPCGHAAGEKCGADL